MRVIFLKNYMLTLVCAFATVASASGQPSAPRADEQTASSGAKPSSTTAKSIKNYTPDSYLEAQLAREKNKHKQYFEGLAKNATESGQYQARQLRVQASQKKMSVYTPNDNAYVPMAARVPGYVPSSTAVPQRSPVYVSQDLEYARMKEQMAEEKAAQLRKVEAQKEASLDQSLANMKSQMKESHVPGAAVARPEGSNLFVRYYGPSPNAAPYEVHPAAARIVPRQ